MAGKDAIKALEAELESAVKTLSSATKDVQSISEAKGALVIGQKKVDDLVAALMATADAQTELKKTLAAIASNSKRVEAQITEISAEVEESLEGLSGEIAKMKEEILEYGAALWWRTGVGLAVIALMLIVLLSK
jgi:hypothetical protein